MIKLTDVRKKAKELKIAEASKMPVDDLIRTIQTKEGNFPCFRTAKDYCDQHKCLWRADCITAA